jgi:predicted metal-dependent hydrolase
MMKTSLYPTQELRRRALAWAVKLRVNPRVIRVQDMRRKWGSCSSAGTVTLASYLVDPVPRFHAFDIAHELLHLRVPTHGRLFMALMSAHVPGWRELEEQRVTSRTNRQGRA